MSKPKGKKKVLVGWIKNGWKTYGFREQGTHPTFGRIRTIRLWDTKKNMCFKPCGKVRITIEEILPTKKEGDL